MSPELALNLIVDPTLRWLEGYGIKSDDRARVGVLSIAGQESKFLFRHQIKGGPATGLWQFEEGGGVKGVLNHDKTKTVAFSVCHSLLVSPFQGTVHRAMEQNDVLACAFARLLLYSDPRPLPAANEEEAWWDYYEHIWRPGKPRKKDWPDSFQAAVTAVTRPR